MGIYDIYRRLSLENLQALGQQQAQAYANEYEGWLRELNMQLNIRIAYGATPAQIQQMQAEIAPQQQHLYDIYMSRVNQLQADVDAQTAVIHQEYDAKDAGYEESIASFRTAPNNTPRSAIVDLGDPEHAPPSYAPRTSSDQPVSDEHEELPAPGESWLGRIAAWFG